MAQSLSEIKAMLDDLGMRPRKRFGQNFLHDQNKLNQIVGAADLSEGELVLEVGPGTGTLTQAMLDAGARVVAVEIDRDLAGLLRMQCESNERFTLIEGDVMAGKHGLNAELVAVLRGGEPFKLIANLPYNIASPLLMNLAIDYPGMKLALVMVQLEVAERFAAKPSTRDFGPLSIVLQSVFEVKQVMKLPPTCFWPAPKVDSAVVQLKRRDEAMVDDLKSLAAFSHMVFQKRRKQVGSILGRGFGFPEDVRPDQRPETLTLEQVIALEAIYRQEQAGDG